MKLAKKTITAETRMGSHKAVSGIIPVFLLLAGLECQNRDWERRSDGVMELWSDAIEKSRMTNGKVMLLLVLVLMIELLHARIAGQSFSSRIFLSGKANDQPYNLAGLG